MSDLLTRDRSLSGLLAGIRRSGSLPLGQAETLPPAAYQSPELYELEVSQLFRQGWIIVGHTSEIPQPGDYRCVDIIGEQLVLVRDRRREAHVLSRVCLHRWMEVATGQGNAKAFQCPYHLWTYSLDGRLVGTPEMQHAEDFDRTTCHLPEIRHEIWRGLVFVNLDGNAEPLGPQLAPLDQQLGFNSGDQVLVREWDWATEADGTCPWDWKIFVENFMECYHHIGSHRSSLQKGSPGQNSWTDTSNHAYSFLHSVKTDQWLAENPWAKGSGNLLHIYPLTVMGAGSQTSSVHRIYPIGAGRCRVVTQSFAAPECVADPEWMARFEERRATSTVNQEDQAVNAAVQRAVMATNARSGRLSHLEQPLWEFYQYLAANLPAD